MIKSTIDAVKAILRTDETIPPREREGFIALLRQGTNAQRAQAVLQEPRLIRRAEAARRLGCSLRLVDRLAKDGILVKRRLPNRQRAAGFLEADLTAVISGRPQSGHEAK